jgi:hypothetical protein
MVPSPAGKWSPLVNLTSGDASTPRDNLLGIYEFLDHFVSVSLEVPLPAYFSASSEMIRLIESPDFGPSRLTGRNELRRLLPDELS